MTQSDNRLRREEDTARKTKRPRVQAPDDDALLVNRQEAALLLGCSVMSLKRMQWDGKLHGIQLRPGATSPFLYRKADVYKLAGITLPPT